MPIITESAQSGINKETVDLPKQVPYLMNTKWEHKIAEGCVNSYDFVSDSTYQFYSCEMEDIAKGSFFIKNDTLILMELNLKDVYSNDGSVSQEEEKVRFKIVFEENYFVLVSREQFSGENWIKRHVPNLEQYRYYQVK
jgi:hypothetical protein